MARLAEIIALTPMKTVTFCVQAFTVIPGEFHQQFLGLKADRKVRDCLPETDDEDDVESK